MTDSPKFDTGAFVRTLRGRQSQEEFAALLGVSRKTVIRIEANEAVPSAELLLKFNVLYGTDPLYVLTGKQGSTAGPPLSAEEQTLVEYFRAASKDVRRTVMGALLGMSQLGAAAGQHNSGAHAVQVGSGTNVTVNAPVHGGVAGRDINNGGATPRRGKK